MTQGFDIDELERLLAAATPGEWRTSAGNETEIFGGKKDVARAYCGGMSGVKLAEAEANAALIVAARNSLPAIITEIRELRAENARLKEGMATIRARKWNTMKEGCDAASEAARIARAALGEPQ